MRILLIGNFSVPYEEENLHNLTLLNQTMREGIDSLAINIGELPEHHAIGIPPNKKIINAKNYLDFIITRSKKRVGIVAYFRFMLDST